MALGRGEGYPRTLAEETQAFLPFNSFVSPIPLPNVENSYARSKAKADAALETLDLSWLIVKPSLVVGQGSYGGTSLMRGLAGLPFVLFLPGPARERFQPIALDDLAAGIAKLALTEAPSRTTLYAAGPETVSLREILLAYRAWLGFGAARAAGLARPFAAFGGRRCPISPWPARRWCLRSWRSEMPTWWCR